MNLINEFRTLFLQLAIWTRAYIISTASGFGNVDYVSQRLFNVPLDFMNKLQLIFGTEAAETFLNLLTRHVTLTQALVNAQSDGDIEAVNATVIELYGNADEIAAFLVQINPFWNNIQWRNLLYNYIAMTFEESTSLLAGDYARDIDVFDRISLHSFLLGDYMANGIMQYLLVRGATQIPV